MKRDPLLWGALTAVLVVLASAEYELARACGFGTYVAAGVPAALDIYAIRSLRAGRDVAAVVVSLILVNAASHLVSSGLLPVSWPLVVAVSAIAPLVLWRVHRLREESAPATLPAVEEAPPQSAPVPAPVPAPEAPPKTARERVLEELGLPVDPAPKAPPVDAPGRPKQKPQGAPKPAAKAPRKAPAKAPRSATRADAKAAIEALYDIKQGRPLEGDMVAALKALPGYPHTSRQHANTIRKEIERERPDLAALGSDNVLALTGS